MGKEMAVMQIHGRDEQRTFLGVQLQEYGKQNPEIRNVILRILRGESTSSKYDLLEVLWTLFESLGMITEFLGELPVVSAESAQKAWDELHEAAPDVLSRDTFDQFRYIIDMGFKTSLNGVIHSPEIRQRVELIFAVIIRMIQIELDQGKTK